MFRSDFPIFQTHPDLVFLDSASSAQKPAKVIDVLSTYFSTNYANIHRGAYDLSMESSLLYERAKKAVAKKLHADSDAEIVFTYNATYAFNLLSRGLVKSGMLQKGDVVLLSKVEHHANVVPWQILAEEYGIIIEWVNLHADGTIDYGDLASKIPHAKVVSLTGASNVTGEVLDLDKVQEIIQNSKFKIQNQGFFILDGSQRFPHMETDVKKYGIDFFVGTGHKVMSDTGIGFFYGRKELLKVMNPAFCGGGAINSVTLEGYEPAGLPFRHEPGTPHIAGAVSLLAAIEYIDSIGGFEVVEKYEQELTEYMLEQVKKLPSSVKLLGSHESINRLGVFSFTFANHHPNDVAEMLADANICVRSGHHCTEPFHQTMGIPASLRASFYIYNTREDVDKFIGTLSDIVS
ncbi:MAG: aminotransferase class V-fold PLP-dependent enzyme [Candidatus Gracilibacteria bacterium]|nr:aminotransferase class V-fold PLP-dependent enzyme [Candidatus Gracilibacteria bacterium]